MDRDELIEILKEIPKGSKIFTFNGEFFTPPEVTVLHLSEVDGEWHEDETGEEVFVL